MVLPPVDSGRTLPEGDSGRVRGGVVREKYSARSAWDPPSTRGEDAGDGEDGSSGASYWGEGGNSTLSGSAREAMEGKVDMWSSEGVICFVGVSVRGVMVVCVFVDIGYCVAEVFDGAGAQK